MEGELVFYDRAVVDAWRPRARTSWRDAADTSSTLGQLYAEWNADNRRARNEYDRRRRDLKRYQKRSGIWTSSSGDDPGARTFRAASSTATTTIETVSIVSGVEVLTVTVSRD
jgi:hypothetical protein